ncbi:MAG: DUF4175 domain-containing protein [Gemmatimonadetes bacterium]|uniref:DUF4175 domain-containing protein n=1 Tax=Candidatus Kutchimonas denitrificans TaxID=3056748 RepID=A0AAE4ZAP6_9BACT|nr:DUF4175 domain-containing protein [Gemmatimonadota bacterium]NIR76718.1 DUF4175 domain-containing protein [Candidatus Kutchimonas denitrificans]NIS01205.1 DUF4175 domain-containing protein [Gemmatimonadota bacterium]NIT68244.1 DUF4175 domain-containing protein [Gemmatimonadota bacterium]NIW75462.1 hypothetical protein [Gemmatimonadota bacterium]
MTVGEIFVLLVIALLFSFVLVGALGWRRGTEPLWPAFLFVLLILFPVMWLASLWVDPVGPVFMGVSWVPVLLVAFIVILIIAAAVPPRPRRVAVAPTPEEETAAGVAFGVFFWLLLIVLVLAIIAGYYW